MGAIFLPANCFAVEPERPLANLVRAIFVEPTLPLGPQGATDEIDD
jgi:hypothetical protein